MGHDGMMASHGWPPVVPSLEETNEDYRITAKHAQFTDARKEFFRFRKRFGRQKSDLLLDIIFLALTWSH